MDPRSRGRILGSEKQTANTWIREADGEYLDLRSRRRILGSEKQGAASIWCHTAALAHPPVLRPPPPPPDSRPFLERLGTRGVPPPVPQPECGTTTLGRVACWRYASISIASRVPHLQHASRAPAGVWHNNFAARGVLEIRKHFYSFSSSVSPARLLCPSRSVGQQLCGAAPARPMPGGPTRLDRFLHHFR